MSIKAMSYYFENGAFTSTELLVMIAIADNANDDGEAWPSVATIARKCRLEERTVQLALKALSDPNECAKLGRTPALFIEYGGGAKYKKNKRGTSIYYLVEYQAFLQGEYTPQRGGTAAIFKKPRTQKVEETRRKFPTPEPRSGERHSPEPHSPEGRSPATPEPRSPQPLEVTPEPHSPNPSLYKPSVREPSEEEVVDLAAPFRADLEQLSNRPLTAKERRVIDDACRDFAGRQQLGVALIRLRSQWKTIRTRHDCSQWLERALANLAAEGAPAPVNRQSYMPDATPYEVELFPPEQRDLAPYEALWEKTKAELQLQLAQATYQTYVAQTKAINGDDTVLKVRSPAHAHSFLEGRLQQVCERTLHGISGRRMTVAFVIG